MIIKILDTEGKNLDKIEFNALKALTQLNKVGTVERLQDKEKLAEKFEIKESPAFIVNDKVKVSGRAPSLKEIVELLQEELN